MLSFCVISKGDRPDKLNNLIQSVKALQTESEIIIAIDANDEGLLGKLRNKATQAATGDYIIVSDDDIVFDVDFYRGLLEYGDQWDVLCTRLLNPDSSRYWDWRAVEEDGKQYMVEYDIPDNGLICPPGALVLLKPYIGMGWSETIKFYEPPYEDIEFARRLHKMGYVVKFNPYSTAYHDDPRYYQAGDVVMRHK